MSIANYSELLTAVANWVDRSDLTARIPEFVVNAESKFNRTLRVREMMSVSSDTMSSSTITLPSDWLAFESLWYLVSSTRYEVSNTTIQEINKFDQGDTDYPSVYYIAGSTVYFHPTSSGDYTVGYVYYQRIPDLATNSTNWLLTNNPDIYLYATMLEAAIFTKDTDDIQKYLELTRGAVLQLEQSDKGKKSGSALRIKAY